MDLIIGDADGHHHIGDGVPFGEQIFYAPAAFYVPVGRAYGGHLLGVLIG
jgi:hypothetical protein